MDQNKKLNIIIGWCVFAFSFIIYFITSSRTVNFWDSGELISCAGGLQVGHPTGSPVYILLGRLFSMFVQNPANIAFVINLLSVFAGAFGIFFLYHNIQKISLRIYKLKIIELNRSQIFISFGASIIGALSFAFSITYWTSAIEANIYPVLVFFISLCIWVMLKSTEAEDENMKNRWVALCSLFIGLGIGVDFQIILIIPALVYIYYFDRYKFGYKTFFKVFFILLAVLLSFWVSIFYIPVIASKFELLFVNSFNFKYNSGLYFFAVFFIGLIVLGIYISKIKNKIRLNFIIVCFALFISGYSTYSIILIRSASDPPIDQNNPETIFNFISYINQDRYGNYPLWYGQQYNSKLDKNTPYIEGEAVYGKINNKYSVITHNPKSNYRSADKVFLPRMWSNQPQHIAAYQEWTGYKNDKPPSFWTNVRFMLNYQFSHMYFRYFMWNFTGRQNDFQSYGGPLNGNWMSGIDFVDNIRLKNVTDLPPLYEGNRAHNVYYFIPFLLGIIGIILQYKYDKKYLFITGLLFIFSSLFLAFYLNLTPYQGRERDYLFLGSFYAFSIWIGLGVMGIYNFFVKYIKSKYLTLTVLLICFLIVPIQFLAKNYDDHNYRYNDLAYQYAYNLLNSCEENAILFTFGDNETFPLWYLQEIERIRPDISIVNISFLNADWYIDQIRKDNADSKGIRLNIQKNKYQSGQRELLLINETRSAFYEDIYYENIREINEDYAYMYNSLEKSMMEGGLERIRPEEFNNFKEFYSKIQPHEANPSFQDFILIIKNLENKDYREELKLSESQAKESIDNLKRFLQKQSLYHFPLNPVLNFTFSDDKDTKISTRLYNYPVDFFPARRLMLRINRNHITDNFNLTREQQEFIVDRMEWEIDRESITKNELMILEIIRSNMWERPLYFNSTMNDRYFLGLDRYLYLEGLAYRLIPIDSEISGNNLLNVNSFVMSQNLIENFEWGGLADQRNYYDENSRKILTNVRNHYSRLANSLYFEGRISESERVLDECVRLLPDNILLYDYYSVSMVKGYYRINKAGKANEIGRILAYNLLKELEFYSKFPLFQQQALNIYKIRVVESITELHDLANYYIDKEFIPEITEIYDRALIMFDNKN